MSSTRKPPEGAERQFVVNRVLAFVVCLSILAAPFFWNAFVGDGPVLCLSRRALGVPCPGCGLTRAFCAAARFDLAAAVRHNALCLPFLMLFAVTPVVALYELAQGGRCRWYRFLYSMRVARVCAAVVILYHAGRLSLWLADGTLVREYLRSAWAWQWIAA